MVDQSDQREHSKEILFRIQPIHSTACNHEYPAFTKSSSISFFDSIPPNESTITEWSEEESYDEDESYEIWMK